MFCSKCGSQIPEGAAFCPNCGQTVGNQPENGNPSSFGNQQNTGAYQSGGYTYPGNEGYPPTEAYTAGRGRRNKGIIAIIIIAIIAIAALAVFLIFNLFSDKEETTGYASYEQPVITYLGSLFEGDAEKAAGTISEDCLALTYGESMDLEMLQSGLEEEVIEPMQENIGDDFDYSIDITDVENAPEDDLQETNELFREYTGTEIEDAKLVRATVTVTADGETDEASTSLGVVKIDGKWYLASPFSTESDGDALSVFND